MDDFDIEKAFGPSNFESIEVQIIAHNLTPRMDFKKSRPVLIERFLSAGLILDAPSKGCSVGHSIMIRIKTISPHSHHVISMSATCQVTQVEPVEGGDQITIEFKQFLEKEWAEFQQCFFSRQEEINNLLQSARGY